MTRRVDTDYLVVGAGAMGMAFTDALIDHADVARHPRRPSPRGRRPLARGVPVRAAAPGLELLRRGVDRARRRAVQQPVPRPGCTSGPASPTIRRLLRRRADRPAARVRPGHVPPGLRATPATAPSCRGCPGERSQVARALPGRGRALPRAGHPGRARRRGSRSPTARVSCRSTTWCTWRRRPSQYVVVGSGKTATDAIVWLLGRGVDPDAIVLGAAARSVDAQPGADPAGTRGLPRHGRRR